MSGTNTDSMIDRLQMDLADKSSFIDQIIGGANDRGTDLTQNEKELTNQARARVVELDEQLKMLYDNRDVTTRAREQAHRISTEMERTRREVVSGPVEYRSAGAYAMDMYRSALGNREAHDRMEQYFRAAAHQKTSDNLGVVPDPIIGGVINFIDAARPLVSFLGAQPLPSATWYRPKVTQHTSVGVQGSAGAAADEKTELGSQKMTIGRVTGTAKTYGGYVNVSRQDIDFSTPQIMDIIINDLAAQYAIQTEAALGAALVASSNTIEIAGTGSAAFTQANLTPALWTAVANIYTATKGAGRIALAVPPDQLGNWGVVFNPINPQNSQSSGFSANDFGQGLMGSISGIPVYCSSGITAGTVGIVFSSAGVEVYEQRVGALQVTEPSVLGVQVAYAGYFTQMTVETGGVQRLINAA